MQIGKLQLRIPGLSALKKKKSDRTVPEETGKEEKTQHARRRTMEPAIPQAASSSQYSSSMSSPTPLHFSNTFPIQGENGNHRHDSPKTEDPVQRRQSLLTRALRRSSMSLSSKLSPLSRTSLSRKSTATMGSSTSSSSPKTSRSSTQDAVVPNGHSVAVVEEEEEDDADSHEKEIEAKLGRKRCISFGPPPATSHHEHDNDHYHYNRSDKLRSASESVALSAGPSTFAYPSLSRPMSRPRNRNRDSAVPSAASPGASQRSLTYPLTSSENAGRSLKGGAPLIRGLGPFKPNETTSFNEFDCDEGDDDWMVADADCHEGDIITVEDCFRKDLAISKLGEEAEAEEKEEEDGNERDDSSAASSLVSGNGCEFPWAHSYLTKASTPEDCEPSKPVDRSLPRSSPSSSNSGGQISLPRSTGSVDFVCGTLDEDKPLKETDMPPSSTEIPGGRKIPDSACLPQDIDPSFPVSDTEYETNNESDYSSSEQRRDNKSNNSNNGRRQSLPVVYSPGITERGDKIYAPVPANNHSEEPSRADNGPLFHRRSHAPSHIDLSPPPPPVLPHTSSFTHTVSDALPRTPMPPVEPEDEEECKVHTHRPSNPVSIGTKLAMRQQKVKEKISRLRLNHRREQRRVSAKCCG